MVIVRLKKITPHSSPTSISYEIITVVENDVSTPLSPLSSANSSPVKVDGKASVTEHMELQQSLLSSSETSNASPARGSEGFKGFVGSEGIEESGQAQSITKKDSDHEKEVQDMQKGKNEEQMKQENVERSTRNVTKEKEDEQQQNKEDITESLEAEPKSEVEPTLPALPAPPTKKTTNPVVASKETPKSKKGNNSSSSSTPRRRAVNHKHMKILTKEQRDTLKDISGQEIIKDMAFYMQHVLGNSRENIKNVMNKVMMLVNGYGVRHQSSMKDGFYFMKGTKITLDHNFAAMDIEANDWVHAHGGDVSHGWLIKLPLRKMWVYQVARYERGEPFFDPSKAAEQLMNGDDYTNFGQNSMARKRRRKTPKAIVPNHDMLLSTTQLPPIDPIGYPNAMVMGEKYSNIPELMNNSTMSAPYDVSSNDNVFLNKDPQQGTGTSTMDFEVSNTAEV